VVKDPTPGGVHPSTPAFPSDAVLKSMRRLKHEPREAPRDTVWGRTEWPR